MTRYEEDQASLQSFQVADKRKWIEGKEYEREEFEVRHETQIEINVDMGCGWEKATEYEYHMEDKNYRRIVAYPIEGKEMPESIKSKLEEYASQYSERDIEMIEKGVSIAIELAAQPNAGKQERFKMPTDKNIVDFALVFNDGKIEHEKLADMVAMCQFIIDRLYENGDILIPSSKENER
jgi:hypothetical protein